MAEYNMGDYNRGGYIAFYFSMATTLVFFIYIAFIHPGVDLKEVEAQIQKEAQVAAPAPAPEQKTAPAEQAPAAAPAAPTEPAQ